MEKNVTNILNTRLKILDDSVRDVYTVCNNGMQKFFMITADKIILKLSLYTMKFHKVFEFPEAILHAVKYLANKGYKGRTLLL